MPSSLFKHPVFKLLVLVLVLALAWWLGKAFFVNEQAMRDFFGRFPFWLAAFLLTFLYIVASFVPFDVKDILKIAGAIMFGMWWSTLFIWTAEMINNAMLFHLSRGLGREWLDRKFGLKGQDLGWVAKLCGVWQIFVLRILPLVPFRLLDLAYGLTAVSFRRYFTVSAVASPIRIFWMQSILAVVGGAVFEPEKVMSYLYAHPETIRFGAVYVFFSFGAAFFLSRKLK